MLFLLLSQFVFAQSPTLAEVQVTRPEIKGELVVQNETEPVLTKEPEVVDQENKPEPIKETKLTTVETIPVDPGVAKKLHQFEKTIIGAGISENFAFTDWSQKCQSLMNREHTHKDIVNVDCDVPHCQILDSYHATCTSTAHISSY